MVKKRILFVCDGNIFRSSVAERLFKFYFGDKFIVSSAGVTAKYSGKAIEEVISKDVLKREKDTRISLDGHVIKRVDKNVMSSSDFVFVMDNKNKNKLARKFPQFSKKIFLLKKFAGYKKNLEIPDAKDKPVEFLDKVYEDIKNSIKRIKKKDLISQMVSNHI